MKLADKFYDYRRDGITQGLLSKFMNCRQETRLFLDGWSPKKSNSAGLTYGSIFHGALEIYYNDLIQRKLKTVPSGSYISKLLADVERKWKSENAHDSNDARSLLELSCGIAEATLPHYFRKWWRDDAKIRWQSMEQEFRIPFTTKDGRKTFLRGKKDGVFGSPNIWLFETKTKSLINEGNLIDTLWYELQVNFYLYAMLKLYKKHPSGVLYNIIRRTCLERKKSETLKAFLSRVSGDVENRPDFYFMRYEISTTKSELLKFETELEGLITDFMDWCDGLVPHYKNTAQCITKYGRCSMLPICSSGAYNQFEKRKTVFRELEDF